MKATLLPSPSRPSPARGEGDVTTSTSPSQPSRGGAMYLPPCQQRERAKMINAEDTALGLLSQGAALVPAYEGNLSSQHHATGHVGHDIRHDGSARSVALRTARFRRGQHGIRNKTSGQGAALLRCSPCAPHACTLGNAYETGLSKTRSACVCPPEVPSNGTCPCTLLMALSMSHPRSARCCTGQEGCQSA